MTALLQANWFKACVFVSFFALWLCAAALIASALTTTFWVVICLIAVGVGFFVADLVSGVVHSLADHLGETDTPIFGPLFIEPFRSHHIDPEAIVHESIWDLCLPAMVSAIPALCVGILTNALSTPNPVILFVATLFWIVPSCAVGACITHQLAHEPSPTKLVNFLQKAGVILSRQQHDLHHREGHLTRFCIFNGWANPVVDAIISRILARKSLAHKATRPLVN